MAKTGISSDDHKDTGLLKTLPGVFGVFRVFVYKEEKGLAANE